MSVELTYELVDGAVSDSLDQLTWSSEPDPDGWPDLLESQVHLVIDGEDIFHEPIYPVRIGLIWAALHFEIVAYDLSVGTRGIVCLIPDYSEILVYRITDTEDVYICRREGDPGFDYMADSPGDVRSEGHCRLLEFRDAASRFAQEVKRVAPVLLPSITQDPWLRPWFEGTADVQTLSSTLSFRVLPVLPARLGS